MMRSLKTLFQRAARPALAKNIKPKLVRSDFTAVGVGLGVVAGGLGLYQYLRPKADYKQIKEEITDILDDFDYDDGSYGPVLVRLAWHSAGTYSAFDKTGGSNGATMRFAPESEDGANAGLHVARKLLEPIKAKHPEISYADLWSLAGTVAIEAMGGPACKWKPGRTDKESGADCPPVGRLPDAARGADHLRAVFYRMGFNDQEIVALSGAHALGRCHTDRSGFDGPWTNAPTTMSNEYFRLLFEEKWTVRNWKGPKQYKHKELMMLPTDMAIVEDPIFRKHAEAYYKDETLFFKDFAKAWTKLQHLGVKGC